MIRSKKYIILLFLFIVVLIGVLPYFYQIHSKVASGMIIYLQHWYFNHPVHFILSYFIDSSMLIIKIQQLMILLLGIGIYGIGFYKKHSTYSILTRILLLFIALFPVQHPWYFTLLLYQICFSKKYSHFYMLFLTCMGLTYLQYSSIKWVSTIATFVPWLTGGFYIFLSFLFEQKEKKFSLQI